MPNSIARLMITLNPVRAVREHGATAVEYGLMLALVAGVIMTVVGALGAKLVAVFNNAVGMF